MKLYPKKLNSVQELKQEKARLNKKLAGLEKDNLFSAASLLGGKISGGGIIPDISALTLIKPIIRIVRNRLAKKRKAAVYNGVHDHTRADGPAGKLKGAAMEFLMGYLKWKAAELSFKALRQIVKQRIRRN